MNHLIQRIKDGKLEQKELTIRAIAEEKENKHMFIYTQGSKAQLHN